MITKTGKLFRNLQTGEIESFSYSSEKNYYEFVESVQKKGYRQCIITSDIMIQILEYFLLNHKTEITKIEFLIDDEDLEAEINLLLLNMTEKQAYWEVLKERLVCISRNDSIDIKKIEFKINEEKGCLCNVLVNGIFSSYENLYSLISKEISNVLGECIK